MDSWPTDDRSTSQTTYKGKGKSKAQPASNYPYVEQGSLTALTLAERNGHLEWSSIVNSSTETTAQRLHAGNVVNVFPATRAPAVHIPANSVSQRAEQGANFLRTYLPDVDIAAELIRDQVAEDIKVTCGFDLFDPYAGNTLHVVLDSKAESRLSGFLAFPMGEVNRELNLSSFAIGNDGKMRIKPSTTPIRTFNTPIRQVEGSSSFSGSFLAVRTYSSISLLQLDIGYIGASTVTVNDLGTVAHSDVGKRAIVDVKLPSTPLESILVNDQGSIYTCNLEYGKKIVMQAMQGHSDSDVFWRLALGSNPSDCLIISGRDAQCVDLRSRETVSLFSIPSTKDLLTGIENIQSDDMIRMCSTSEVLWIDPRYPRKPVLAYKHGRQFDRYLETRTVFIGTPLTLLSSRRNGLLTVYDVSRSDDHLVHVNVPPYSLTSDKGTNEPHTGQAFVQYLPHLKSGIARFTASERGEVLCQDLYAPDPRKQIDIQLERSSDLQALEIEAMKLHPDVGPLGMRDHSQIDLFPTYDQIFRIHGEDAEKAEEQKVNAVYELLDRLPSFWQDNTEPVEHVLTTSEIIFRAGEEPESGARAEFLAQSILNSKRGFRALSQGQLSVKSLKPGAAWYRKLTSVLKHLDADAGSDFDTMNQRLHRFDLDGEERSPTAIRREVIAREQVAVDLALSQDIFSAQLFRKPSNVDQELETMTEALSLGGSDEPPPVHLGYLRPVPKSQYDEDDQPQEVKLPIGVRLLLDDWVLGSHPEEYIYTDPYDGNSDPQAIIHRMKAKLPSPRPTQDIMPTQERRPPTVIASSSILPTPLEAGRRSAPIAQSQVPPVASRLRGFESQASQPSSMPQASQDFMTSTQILPGPFGGRPTTAKKKPAKKRVGGF